MTATTEVSPLDGLRAEWEQGALDELPAVVVGQSNDCEAEGNAEFEMFLAFEDICNGRGVFTNGIGGQRCSAASYMTVFNYDKFAEVMTVVGVDRFNRNGWRSMVAYHRHNRNLSPILGILASEIARAVGLPAPLVKDAATEEFYLY